MEQDQIFWVDVGVRVGVVCFDLCEQLVTGGARIGVEKLAAQFPQAIEDSPSSPDQADGPARS